jgi:hypothetical protein
MNWFKRQRTFVKIIIAGFIALMFLCACAVGLAMIAPKPPLAATPTPEKPTSVLTPTVTRAPGKPTPMPPTPTPAPIGMSRISPAPMGQAVVADNRIEITVLGLERNAWPKIQQINPFNPKPKEGMEYIIVTVRVRNLGDPAKTKRVSQLDFRVVGERGVIYEPPFGLILEKPIDAELFGGGVIEGQLGFQVEQGEKGLILIYDSGLDTTARYLSLEQ